MQNSNLLLSVYHDACERHGVVIVKSHDIHNLFYGYGGSNRKVKLNKRFIVGYYHLEANKTVQYATGDLQ